MSSIKFSVNTNKTNKKTGLAPIRATISINSLTKRKNIEKIQPRYWNKLKQRVRPNRETEPDNRHVTINKLLDDYQAKANDSFNYCKLNNIQINEKHVAEILNGAELKEKNKHDFNEVFLKFIEDTKATKKERTYKGYQTAYKFYLTYQDHTAQKLTFEKIDFDFFDSFKNYCYNVRERKTTTNYFAKNITVLKTFLNWSKTREYHNESKYLQFSAPEIEVDKVYLTEDEIINLIKFQFEREDLTQARDFFLFGCYTALRFSDLYDLKREHIQGNYIEKTIIKTRTLEKIPIIDQAQQIIDKYHDPVFVLPRLEHQEYNLLIKDCCELVGITQQTVKTVHYGSETKEIIMPKNKRISAHVSRKTAATTLILNNMSEGLVKNVTGHKTDKEFQKYIGSIEDTIKTETQKAWNLVTDPKKKKTVSEMTDEEFVNLLKESRKSGKGNKQKLIEYLNSLEDPDPEQ